MLSAPALLATPSVTADLAAKKDNTIYEPSFGQELSNGGGQHIFVGATANPPPDGDIRRALVNFDIAGVIPAGSTITSVILDLNMSKTMAPVQTITMYRVLSDWGEGASVATGEE
ncbi:MAG TPA: hypothetical protein VMV81_03100, partial [Phycisphaerae bacterium]|nr:hypothetical protein [Phycisphaerae bacterium]